MRKKISNEETEKTDLQKTVEEVPSEPVNSQEKSKKIEETWNSDSSDTFSLPYIDPFEETSAEKTSSYSNYVDYWILPDDSTEESSVEAKKSDVSSLLDTVNLTANQDKRSLLHGSANATYDRSEASADLNEPSAAICTVQCHYTQHLLRLISLTLSFNFYLFILLALNAIGL